MARIAIYNVKTGVVSRIVTDDTKGISAVVVTHVNEGEAYLVLSRGVDPFDVATLEKVQAKVNALR